MSAYFGQLTAWGYAASDVEQLVIDHAIVADVRIADDIDAQEVESTEEANAEDD